MTDSRMLARNTALNLAGQAVPIAVALVSIPWLIRGLGADRFGVLTLAWAAIGYFGLVDLGLGRALTHAVAIRLGSNREDELESVGWTALVLMFVLGAAGGLMLAMATPWLVTSLLRIPPELRNEGASSFYLLAASLPLVVSTAGLRGIIEAHQHFGLGTALRVPLGIFSYLGPLAVLPFTHRLDVVVAVLVFGRTVGWMAHLALCVKRYPFLKRRISVRLSVIGPLFRVGGWMTVSNVVSPLMTYLDRFLIGALLPVAAVAYYVTPYEAVMKLLIFPSALMGVFFPAFAESFARDRVRSAQLLDKSVRAVVLVIFPACLVLVTLAGEILRLWVGAEFARAGAPVLQWLAAGVLINSVGFVAFSFLQGVGRADLTGKTNLVELPFYAMSIWIFAKTLGLPGVAIAWTLRVFVDAIVLVAMARGRLRGERGMLHTPVLLWAAMAVSLAVGALLPGVGARVAYVIVALAVYAPFAWFALVTAGERRALLLLLRRSVASIRDSQRQAA